MDSLAFEIKRAHWGINMTAMRRFRLEADNGRSELRRMTPARFDVLFLILQRMEALGARPGDELLISLGELVIKLGHDKSTIARTVRSMEEHAFVVRRQDHRDRRLTIVVMTELGLRAVRAVLELLRFEPNFVVERIRWWLGMIDEPHHAVDRAALHRVYATRIRKLARLFDRWAYPVYAPGFDPRAVYTMPPLDPAPRFSNAPILRAAAF